MYNYKLWLNGRTGIPRGLDNAHHISTDLANEINIGSKLQLAIASWHPPVAFAPETFYQHMKVF